MFKTNKDTEKNGITLNYGDFYLVVGRAGGANQKFKGAIKRIMDPHRRALQTDTLSEKKVTELMIQAYAESNVYDWGYKANPEDKDFIAGKFLAKDDQGNDVVLDLNRDNIIKVFTDLPDLFSDVQEQAGKVSLFRDEITDEDAKNL
jgi:hypothetical protein